MPVMAAFFEHSKFYSSSKPNLNLTFFLKLLDALREFSF